MRSRRDQILVRVLEERIKKSKNPRVSLAPWTKLEIANLDAIQRHLAIYKCPLCNVPLIINEKGFFCVTCGYDRDWAYAADAEGETLKRRT